MNRTLGYGLMVVALTGGSASAFAAYSSSGNPPSSTHAATIPGYLGVDLRDISDEQSAALHQRDSRGAEIVLVDHDAPAGKAGLREHDIVLRINGQPIFTQDQARRILHDCAPTSSVILFISREGQLLTVTAHMSTREEVEREAWSRHLGNVNQNSQDPPPSEAASSSVTPSAGPAPAAGNFRAGNSFIGSILMNSSYTGAMLEQLSGQLAQFFGSSTGTGLLVRSVADNSPAAVAGLHAGDVVIRADGKPVATTSDWAKAVKGSHGHPLAVVVLRDKHEQTLSLTPDGKHRSSLEELIATPERTIVAHLNLNWVPHF